MDDPLIFFHAPNSRAFGTAVLLEELGAPHERRVLNLKAGEQRRPDYLAINPMGKVPALLHRGALITEQAAIYLYLADLFPQAGLTPGIGDAARGPFLRWLAFYGSCFEPAVTDKALKREPAPPSISPYGSFDDMLGTLTAQLRGGPYILGDRFTASDILWGTSLRWILLFKLLPELPEITGYVERVTRRPSVAKVEADDAALVAAQTDAGS